VSHMCGAVQTTRCGSGQVVNRTRLIDSAGSEVDQTYSIATGGQEGPRGGGGQSDKVDGRVGTRVSVS